MKPGTAIQIFTPNGDMHRTLLGALEVHYCAGASTLTVVLGDQRVSHDVNPRGAATVAIDEDGSIHITDAYLPASNHAFLAWLCGFRHRHLYPLSIYERTKSGMSCTAEYVVQGGAIRLCYEILPDPEKPPFCRRACATLDFSRPITERDIKLLLVHMQRYIPRSWAAARLQERGFNIRPEDIAGGCEDHEGGAEDDE